MQTIDEFTTRLALAISTAKTAASSERDGASDADDWKAIAIAQRLELIEIWRAALDENKALRRKIMEDALPHNHGYGAQNS